MIYLSQRRIIGSRKDWTASNPGLGALEIPLVARGCDHFSGSQDVFTIFFGVFYSDTVSI